MSVDVEERDEDSTYLVREGKCVPSDRQTVKEVQVPVQEKKDRGTANFLSPEELNFGVEG